MEAINKESNFLSAVLYVHNGAALVEAALARVYALLRAHFSGFEIICVDDASTDDSCARIKSAAACMADAPVTIVHMGYFQGVENAMRAGVGYSIGDFVFEFDSLVMDYPEALPLQVYRRAISGFDAVSAVPRGASRRSSRLFYRLFNRNFPGGAALRSERFRILSRRIINRINAVSACIPYRKVAYIGSGLKCGALEYEPVPGAADLPLEKCTEELRRDTAVDTLMLFTDVAYKFSITLSLLMAAIVLLCGVYTVVVFVAGNPVSGWTTTMLLLSVGLFGIFCILSMMIKYLAIVVRLLFRKQSYVVSDAEKLMR